MAIIEIVNQTYLEAAQSSVSFGSIPATYTHLKAHVSAKTDSTSSNHYDAMKVRFNSDATSNWYIFQLYGTGSTLGFSSYVSGNDAFWPPLATSQRPEAESFGVTEILIPDYTSTDKYKSAASTTYNNQTHTGSASGTVYVLMAGGISGSGTGVKDSAISTVSFTPYTGSNFTRGSVFTLYGLKSS